MSLALLIGFGGCCAGGRVEQPSRSRSATEDLLRTAQWQLRSADLAERVEGAERLARPYMLMRWDNPELLRAKRMVGDDLLRLVQDAPPGALNNDVFFAVERLCSSAQCCGATLAYGLRSARAGKYVPSGAMGALRDLRCDSDEVFWGACELLAANIDWSSGILLDALIIDYAKAGRWSLLRPASRHASERVRTAVAGALGYAPRDDASQEIASGLVMAALEDPAEPVVKAALVNLRRGGALALRGNVRAALETLAAGSASQDVRKWALKVLANVSNPAR